jgi:DNA topoisomerase IB
MARIRRVDCSGPGIARRGRGRSFTYTDVNGQTVSDPEVGNTPAVCRASYIDPRVFDRFRSGLTIAGALEQLGQVDEPGEPAHQGPTEEAVLDLIEEKHGPAPELDLIA